MRPGQLDLLDLPMPLTLHPRAPVSDEDLMRFSAHNKPYKVERNKEGDLTIMTPVGGIGSTQENYVAARLYLWADQRQNGVSFNANAGFNLPDGSCLSPDAAWVALDRWNSLTLTQQTGYPPLCPDFVIEIRSRTDPRRMVEAKMQAWLDNGAALAWLIDPIEATVTVYRPGRAPQTLIRPETVKAGAPVEDFELPCTRLW
jgi:Uma2 family endonuclease